MKRLLLLFICIFALALHAQQSKQVYITLDVSGSMTGDKYALANYTTQMIVALCEDTDDVHIIIYGQEKNLSAENNPLAVIQRPMKQLVFGKPKSRTSQFDDIVGFNKVYSPAANRANWLFIVGDGDWLLNSSRHNYGDDLVKFKETVESGELNVCYLQTGNNISEQNDFTTYAEGLGLVDIRKSSTDPQTIQDGCDHFAKKILGFSETALDIRKDGAKAVNITAELPVKEFLLVYQDETAPEKLPKLVSAQCNGNLLNIEHKGTPTTKPVKDSAHNQNLSGNVWRIKANGTIPANSQIIVEFDKEVDTKKIHVYPIVKDIEFGTLGFTPVGQGLNVLDGNTFSICEDERTALVTVELNAASKNSIPEHLLKKTRIVVKANNREYPAKYNNGRFESVIDLQNERTQYYAECDCPGYFSRVTPIKTIVKGDCEPPTPPVRETTTTDLGTISFQELRDYPVRGTIKDAETMETLDPNKFDLAVEVEDDFMYDEPKLSIEGNTVVLDIHPRGDWCECLFPTDLNIKVISSPKAGAFEASDRNYVQTVHPIHLRIEKDRPWLTRCFWVLATLVGLFFFVIYLRLLVKKKRFKKNAMMTPRYYSYYGDLIEDQGGTKLRKDGFGAWFSRWLLPGDERTTLSFDKPLISGLTLIASESREVVNVLKSSCDWETMDVAGYDPETDIDKSKTIKLSDMSSIGVTAPNGSKDGELIFTAGSENDGASYRFICGLLMGLSILAIIALIFLMIKSI